MHLENVPINKELQKAFRILNTPFVAPSQFTEKMWGPLIPRPEYLADINKRLVLKEAGVLYVGPTSLGKTTAVLQRFTGLRGVVYFSMREVQDEFVYPKFALAMGLDPTKGGCTHSSLFFVCYTPPSPLTSTLSHALRVCLVAPADSITLEFEFTELATHWYTHAGNRMVLIIDDIHSKYTPLVQFLFDVRE